MCIRDSCDAVTHRFINADGYFQAGTSILDGNTFAYCANNPIYSSDPTGSYMCIRDSSYGVS